MTFASDIAGDYAYMDGIETVTFTDRSSGTETASVSAHRSKLSFREVMAGGPAGLEGNTIVWNLWATTMSGVTPQQGDMITESDGTKWTIVSVSAVKVGATTIRYRCPCNQQGV